MSKQLQRRSVVLGTGSVLTVGLAGCLGDDSDDGDDTASGNGGADGSSGNGNTDGGLAVIESELIEPTVGNWFVEGVVENTGEPVDYVGAAAALFDPSGEQISGVRGDTEDGLEAGDTWEFSLQSGVTHEDDVDDYEVVTSDNEDELRNPDFS